MTKDKAIQEFINMGSPSFVMFGGLIEEIYRDFENSRCENCKHWNDKECLLLPFGGWDDYNDSPCEYDFIETKFDFSCNKWESK